MKIEKKLKKFVSFLLSFLLIFQSFAPAAVYAVDEVATPSATIANLTPIPTSTPTPSPEPITTVIPVQDVTATITTTVTPTSTPEITPTSTLTPTPNTSPSPSPTPTTDPTTPLPSPIPVTAPPQSGGEGVQGEGQGEVLTSWNEVSENTDYRYRDSDLVIHFTKIEKPGKLTIKQINLSPDQVKATGALSDTAYDITSDMANGTFVYDLTLPLVPNAADVTVKFASSTDKLNESQKVTQAEELKPHSITIRGLNHFTIFYVTGGTDQATNGSFCTALPLGNCEFNVSEKSSLQNNDSSYLNIADYSGADLPTWPYYDQGVDGDNYVQFDFSPDLTVGPVNNASLTIVYKTSPIDSAADFDAKLYISSGDEFSTSDAVQYDIKPNPSVSTDQSFTILLPSQEISYLNKLKTRFFLYGTPSGSAPGVTTSFNQVVLDTTTAGTFVTSSTYIRANGTGDIAAQVKVPDFATEVNFTFSKTGYSETIPGYKHLQAGFSPLNGYAHWRVKPNLSNGEYLVTAQYIIDGINNDVVGNATTYSVDEPWAKWVYPNNDNQYFRPSDNPLRIRVEDEFSQFSYVVFNVDGHDYRVNRDQCDLREAGNNLTCDANHSSTWTSLSEGAYDTYSNTNTHARVKVTTYTKANNRFDPNEFLQSSSELSSRTFYVDGTSPILSDLQIDNASSYYSSSVVTSAIASDNFGIKNISFYITSPRIPDDVCDGNGTKLAELSPTSTDSDGRYRASINTLALNGVFCLNAIAEDNAAGHSNIEKSKIIIDNTAPTTPGDPFTTAPTNFTSQIWIWLTSTDPGGVNVSGVKGYWFNTSVIPTWTYLGNFLSTTTDFSSDGLYQFSVEAEDNAGNRSATSTGSVTVDRTPPTVPTNGTPNGTSFPTNNFDFNWDNSTDSLPITYEFQSSLNSHQTAGVLTTGLWHSGTLSSNTIHSSDAPDGTWYWQVRASDSVGNTSAWGEIWNVTLDHSKPVVDAGADQLKNSTFVQNATVSDSYSGISTYQWEKVSGPGTVTFSSANIEDPTISADTDGVYIIRLTATDNVGNSASDEFTLTWDATAPTATVTYSTTSPTNSNVTATLHPIEVVTITNNGVSTEYLFTDNGSFTFEFVDLAGNTGSATATVSNIDKNAPPAPINTSPPDGTFTTTAKQTKIDWGDVTDPEGNDPVTYRYQSSLLSTTNLDGSFTIPSFTSGSLSISEIPTSGTPEGKYYWHVRAVDGVGNLSSWSDPWSVTVDNTNPSAPSGLSTSPNPTRLTDQIWSWLSSTDDRSGIHGYWFHVDSDAPTSIGDVLGWITHLTEGSYNFYLQSEDNSGNKSNETSRSLIVDTTAPSEGSLVINGGDLYATNRDVTLTISATDPMSGVSEMRLANSSSYHDWEPYVTTKSWTLPDTDGLKIIRAKFKDNADNENESYLASDTIILDRHNPSSSAESSNHVNSSTIPVSFTASDTNGEAEVSGVGLTELWYRYNNGSWIDTGLSLTGTSGTFNFVPDSEGTYDFYTLAVDNAVNQEQPSYGENESINSDSTTIYDHTKPTSVITSPTNNGSDNTIYTNNWTGQIDGTATDDHSGLKRIELSIQRATDGTFWTGAIWVVPDSDGVEPRVVASGTTSWTYSLSGSFGEDSYEIISHAVDNADNVENSYKLTIIYDKTIPEVKIILDPADPDSGNGWYKTEPTITLTATDNTATDHIEYQWDSQSDGSWTVHGLSFKTPGEGNHTLYYRALDKAGNISATGIKVIKYDKTDLENGPQNVSVSPNPTSGHAATVKWEEAKDNIGIEKYEVNWSLDGTSTNYTDTVGNEIREHEINKLDQEGKWNVRVIAYDYAGNKKTGSVELTVDRGAPIAPVLSLGGTGIGTATLNWVKVNDVVDYILWYGNETGKYIYGARVGNGTSFTVHGLGGGNYYFVIQSVDGAGNRSSYSNEVSTLALVGAPGVNPGAPAEGFTPEVKGVTTDTVTPTLTPEVKGESTSSNHLSWWFLLFLPTGFGFYWAFFRRH